MAKRVRQHVNPLSQKYQTAIAHQHPTLTMNKAARSAQLKRTIAQQFSTDREAYTNGKSADVRTIKARNKTQIA